MPVQNLDFLISGSASDGFSVRIIESPQGRTADPAPFPLRSDASGAFAFDSTPIPASLAALSSQTALEDVGSSLFRALVSADAVQDILSATLGAASAQNAEVRLRFQIEADSLNMLPLELLYHDPDGFLSLSPRVSIARYVAAGAGEIRTLYTPAPLKLLVVSAAPNGFPSLDTAREIKLIRGALEPIINAGILELYEAANLPLNALRALARDLNIHALHFIGHGDFNGGDPVLALADRAGNPLLVSAEQLAANLASAGNLRLVVLSACDSAANNTAAPFAGIAPRLIQRAGLPAVLAMQAKIRDSGAVAFAQNFYRELASGGTIDAAVREGRLGIFNLGGQAARDFPVPALFVRPGDAQVFDFPARQRERILHNLQTAGEPPLQSEQLAQLATTYAQIAGWKALHDLLQTLDGTFEIVARAVERGDVVMARSAWTLSQTTAEQIRAYSANPTTAIVTVPFAQREDGSLMGDTWAVQIAAAAHRVELALRAADLPACRRAARELSLAVQTHLNVSDKALEDLVGTLPILHLESGAAAASMSEITTLHRRLSTQTRLHNLLQDFLDAFRRVRDETQGDPSTWDSADIDAAWRFCHASVLDSRLRPYADTVHALGTNGAVSGTTWAVELFGAAANLDAAIESSSLDAIGMTARDLDAALRKHFFLTDQQLKDITSELQTLALQLRALTGVNA